MFANKTHAYPHPPPALWSRDNPEKNSLCQKQWPESSNQDPSSHPSPRMTKDTRKDFLIKRKYLNVKRAWIMLFNQFLFVAQCPAVHRAVCGAAPPRRPAWWWPGSRPPRGHSTESSPATRWNTVPWRIQVSLSYVLLSLSICPSFLFCHSFILSLLSLSLFLLLRCTVPFFLSSIQVYWILLPFFSAVLL